jgi:hypothetical protein
MYSFMFAGAALFVATRARATGVAQRDIADYPGCISSATAAEVTITRRDEQTSPLVTVLNDAAPTTTTIILA